jgi:hypothetical protein
MFVRGDMVAIPTTFQPCRRLSTTSDPAKKFESAETAMDEKRRAEEAAAGVPKAKQGRGVASEVALARRDSAARGGRHFGLAKALVHEMPHTLAALECGALSEWRATLIARKSACLTVEDRRVLDAELCADVSKLEGMGDARITAAAKEIAARLDAQAVVDRAAKAEADRTVTIRPAPDCMTYVSALLPVAQGVGVYAALRGRMMRRRSDGAAPPAELLEFDGIRDGYATPAAWRAALDQWEAARRRWAKAHGVAESDQPMRIGDEPWDETAI